MNNKILVIVADNDALDDEIFDSDYCMVLSIGHFLRLYKRGKRADFDGITEVVTSDQVTGEAESNVRATAVTLEIANKQLHLRESSSNLLTRVNMFVLRQEGTLRPLARETVRPDPIRLRRSRGGEPKKILLPPKPVVMNLEEFVRSEVDFTVDREDQLERIYQTVAFKLYEEISIDLITQWIDDQLVRWDNVKTLRAFIEEYVAVKKLNIMGPDNLPKGTVATMLVSSHKKGFITATKGSLDVTLVEIRKQIRAKVEANGSDNANP